MQSASTFIDISNFIGRHLACSEQKDDPDEAKLLDEMKAYGDIWRIDMVDTYADLALKTLKMFSILPARVDADFYFKVDDDVAMNVGAMAEYLQSKRTQGNLYLVCNPAQNKSPSLLGPHSTPQGSCLRAPPMAELRGG